MQLLSVINANFLHCSLFSAMSLGVIFCIPDVFSQLEHDSKGICTPKIITKLWQAGNVSG